MMKKNALKKLLGTMAVTVLFSTTVVYAATSYTHSYEMHPGQVEYTNKVVKETTASVSILEQSILNGTTTYVVVDSLYGTKSDQVNVTGANTVNIPYHSEVVKGEVLRLKSYNNPANNQGRTYNLTFRWTP